MDAFTITILFILTWVIVGVFTSGSHTSSHTEYDPNGWVSLKDIKGDDDRDPQTITDDNIQGYQYNGLI